MCLPREEPEPHRDAENQYKADAHQETPKSGGLDIDKASHSDCNYGKHNASGQGN